MARSGRAISIAPDGLGREATDRALAAAASAAAVAGSEEEAAASAAADADDVPHPVETAVMRSVGRGAAWIIPAAYAVAAIAIGMGLPRLEQRLSFDLISGISSASAIAIYSSVAAGTMTLSAIVFSLTFVMVQFGATVYSPRLVLWLAENRLISHALGVFTGTYLYAIAWVDRHNVASVPITGVVVAVVWLLASIAAFIALIKHIAALQVNRMLAFTGNQGRRVIAALYPDNPPSTAEDEPDARSSGRPTQVVAHHGRPRAVQAIDAGALLKLTQGADARIEVAIAVGDTDRKSTRLNSSH